MAKDLVDRKGVPEEKKPPREIFLQVMCSFAALCMSMSSKTDLDLNNQMPVNPGFALVCRLATYSEDTSVFQSNFADCYQVFRFLHHNSTEEANY
jgi:hypothetical protein